MPLTVPQTKRLARSVRIAAAALALGCLAALTALGWSERRQALEDDRRRLELLARVLEDQATRSVESAALVLRTVADDLALVHGEGPARVQPLLAQALMGQPVLRGLAVLDMQGRVIASSEPRELGLHVDLSRLDPLPPAGRDVLMPLQPGRGLGALVHAGNEAPVVRQLPLVRRVQTSNGQDYLLLALINPDALSNYEQGAIGDAPGSRAALVSYQGQLLAATSQLTLPLGSLVVSHPVFSEKLALQEHGSYLGHGLASDPQVVAYRVSRTRPLVVLVEESESAALQDWRDGLWVLGVAGAVSLAFITAVASLLLRGLRARAHARLELDRAHEQVALRERELSVLFKSVQELIFRADAEGRLSFVNARWDLLNRDRAQGAIGKRIQDLVEPADRDKVAALFSLDDSAGARACEARLLTGDGRLRHFQIAVVPLLSAGRILGFAGSANDVTERLAAEQQVQRQLALTGLLLEISPQPISMVDAKGRYALVNRAWEDLTGRARDRVIGRDMGFFLPDEQRRQEQEQYKRLFKQGGRLSYEIEILHRDGRSRDMQATKVAVPDEHGGIAGVLCSMMDVSEFRAAERATREAKDAAEEASRAKSEFIANISHELRTPLQSILGFSELGMTRGRDQPKLAGMFSDVHNSGQRMLALVNDLLDVSKIESAVGTFDLERCDLRQLVNAVSHELEPLLARRSLRLASHLPETSLTAKVDPLRFQQVLRNVLANAIKFAPEGSTVELDATHTPENEIHISIADRGPGIPPGEIDKIFDAFVQSSKTKDGSGGTGLGLAICRKILEVHGGRIHAENRPEGGACFHIVVPARAYGDSQIATLL